MLDKTLVNRWQQLMAAAGVLTACDSSVLVGSTCEDGVCPFAEGADACVVRVTRRSVRTAPPEEGFDAPTFSVCLPTPLRRDSAGLTPSHMYWIFDQAEGLTRCEDLDFLQRVSPDEAGQPNGTRANYCEVGQLAVLLPEPAYEPQQPEVPAGPGFYYDDFSDELADLCPRANPHRIALAGTQVPAGVNVIVQAQELLDRGGDSTSAAICSAAADVSRVGDACVPPLDQYSDSQSVIATRVDACGGGACLAFHLDGSLGEGCDQVLGSRCIDPEMLAERSTCTCRCDAPEPDAELCACPDQFACVPMVGDGPLAGSYCVPNSIVAM